jgi:hypothetical protein
MPRAQIFSPENSPPPVMEIDGLLHGLRTEIVLDDAARAGGIDDDGGGLVLESVAGEDEVVTVRGEGDGFRTNLHQVHSSPTAAHTSIKRV